GGRAPAKAAVIPAGITAPPSLSPPPRLVLGLGPETAAPWVMGWIAGRSDWRMGDGDGQEDCGGVHGSGRRLCRREYGQGRRGRDLHRFLAQAHRAHETASDVVSLQNYMNEETIAGVVGMGKTLGSIASSITVELHAPGQIKRAAGKSGSKHTVFRVGEVHGRVTDRAKEVCGLLANADSAFVTENLWGERWSKLVTNVMGNGLSACTGLIGREVVKNDVIRHFSNRLGSEAIRVGQALGYTFDEVSHMDPEMLARAGEGDPAAQKEIDDHRLAVANTGGGEHRPSTGQDMVKGRRTEIPFLNGFVVRKGEEVGVPAPTNAILT